METLNRLTHTINHFVRFFESINCLFWQIRWLEENIRKSNLGQLFLVSGIAIFCVILVFADEKTIHSFSSNMGIDGDIAVSLYRSMPLLIVFGVIIYFFSQRFFRSRFDRDDSHYRHDNRENDIEMSVVRPVRVINRPFTL